MDKLLESRKAVAAIRKQIVDSELEYFRLVRLVNTEGISMRNTVQRENWRQPLIEE